MAVKASAAITLSTIRDISSVTWYYQLKAGTTAPDKPTVSPPPSPWSTAEPSYTAGDTKYLFVCERTVYTDGTFEYTDPSLSSSYEAAKLAYNKASSAEDLAKETNQHFWFVSTDPGNGVGAGVHITKVESDDFIDNPEDGGGNLLAKDSGIEVREGTVVVASFGATGARIGRSGTSVLELKTDGITGYGEEGNKCFCVETNGGTESTTVHVEVPTESIYIKPPTGDLSTIDSCPIMDVIKSLPSLSTGTVVDISSLFGKVKAPSTIDFTSVSWSEQNNWRRDVDFFNTRTITYMPPENATITIGTAATFSCTNDIQIRKSGSQSYMRIKYKITYNPSVDGNNIRLGIYANQNATMFSGYFYFGGEIQYVSTAKTPITTFGERSGQGGSYSAVIGKALYANGNNQTAIGKYNEADNSNKYALIIGNGSSYSSRSNALSVDWYGNLISQGMAGMIQMFAGSTAPSGWLLCQGQAVSRTTYAKLYSVIGTKWGSGDGSTTFNLPDLRGRAPIGAGTGTGLTARTLGDISIGEEAHKLTSSEAAQKGVSTNGMSANASHKHEMGYKSVDRGSGSTGTRMGPYGSTTSGVTVINTASTSVAHTHSITASDAANAHNNMQPSAVVNFIICTGLTT